MPYREKTVQVCLPELEASEMTARAAMEGLDAGRYIGIQALRSFCGVRSPATIEFEKRAIEGQVGTGDEGGGRE